MISRIKLRQNKSSLYMNPFVTYRGFFGKSQLSRKRGSCSSKLVISFLVGCVWLWWWWSGCVLEVCLGRWRGVGMGVLSMIIGNAE